MDREKVIKGLEELYGFLFREYANIPAEESKIYYERTCAIHDAIAMLKEQESLAQIKPHKDRGWWVCECKAAISVDVDGEPLHKCKFCSECGRAVNWDDLPV